MGDVEIVLLDHHHVAVAADALVLQTDDAIADTAGTDWADLLDGMWKAAAGELRGLPFSVPSAVS